MSDRYSIGDGKAIIYCRQCGMIIGVWHNAEKNQETLSDCYCVYCYNKGIIPENED